MVAIDLEAVSNIGKPSQRQQQQQQRRRQQRRRRQRQWQRRQQHLMALRAFYKNEGSAAA